MPRPTRLLPLIESVEHCCYGHACDGCPSCVKGRCCRKDNPDYRLPELGDWDGVMYGELGVFADDGDKAECHCCGRWYRHLGNHVARTHGLTADEYRSIFGLRQSTGLIGPALLEKRREAGALLYERYGALTGSSLADLTPEQRSANSRRHRVRLESRKDPKWKAAQAAAVAAMLEGGAAARREGRMKPSDASHMLTPEVQARARAGGERMRSDPVRHAAWKEKIRQKQIAAQARKGRDHVPKTKTITCDVCLTTVERVVTTSKMAKTMHLCGASACRSEYRRRVASAPGHNNMHTPEARAKVSAAARRRHLQHDPTTGRIVTWDRDP